MTNEPEFRDLIGDEGRPEELGRLRRVHDLLVAAGPPPELSPAVAHPPVVEESKVLQFRRRRPTTVFALAAALAASFVIGYAVADKHTSFSASTVVPMHGIGQLVAAQADIKIGSHDSGGNYPLEMTVRGLPRLPKGGWYELLLSKHGHPTLNCGDFAVNGTETTVRLSVPYDLTNLGRNHRYDGWVVVRHAPAQHTTPVVMTT